MNDVCYITMSKNIYLKYERNFRVNSCYISSVSFTFVINHIKIPCYEFVKTNSVSLLAIKTGTFLSC